MSRLQLIAPLALAFSQSVAGASSAALSGDPLTLAVVLDTSGSVGRELERTRALGAGVLEHLPAGSEAALFTFDDEDRLLLPWTAAAGDLRRALGIVRPTGHLTMLYDALYDASRRLREVPAPRKALLLLTDGKDEGSTLALEDGLRVAQDSRIPIFAVGVGRVEEKILRRIAKLTDGAYVPLAAARPETLAPAIEHAATAAAATEGGGTRRSSDSAGAAPSAPAGSVPAASPAPGGGRRALSTALVLGISIPVALGTLVGGVVFRRRRRPHCRTCGFELPSELARCTNCSAAANARLKKAVKAEGARPQPVRVAAVPADARRQREAWPRAVGSERSGLSETLLSRLENTEEFLEKTVTLREQPVLVVTAGPGSGRVFSLGDQAATSIGRAKMNDIVLEDISVSSEHCRIRSEDGGFVVHDLKSTNGTYVNEKKIAHHPLAAGDTLKVGETSLQYRLDHQRAN